MTAPTIADGLRSVLRRDPHASLAYAEAYAAGGDRAHALDWLRHAVSLGVTGADDMRSRSPCLAPRRGDTGFEAIVTEARARR